MTRKTVIIWLSLVMVAILGFYNNGYSVCPVFRCRIRADRFPPSCKLYDSCTGIDSGFTLETYPSGGVWPIRPIPADNRFKWRYKITVAVATKCQESCQSPPWRRHCCTPNNYTTGGTAIYQPGVGDLIIKVRCW